MSLQPVQATLRKHARYLGTYKVLTSAYLFQKLRFSAAISIHMAVMGAKVSDYKSVDTCLPNHNNKSDTSLTTDITACHVQTPWIEGCECKLIISNTHDRLLFAATLSLRCVSPAFHKSHAACLQMC